ncbi:MAG: sigma 54-interacting transcriptional regulator [Bacillota bacterium]
MIERIISSILNSTHDALVAININEEIVIFNTAAEKLIGRNAEDVMGRPVKEVIKNTRLPEILKTGIAEINQQQNLDEINIITNRVPVFDQQGRIIGAAAVFRDISEVIQLAEKITNLQQIKSLLEAVINSTQDAISVVDEKGYGIMINPAYTKLTGLKEEDVLNKPATVDIAEGESMHLHVLKTRKPVKGVVMKVGPNRREVVVNVAPIEVNGTLKGSVGVIQDISEIKKLSQELYKAKRIIRRLEAKYNFADIVGNSEHLKSVIEQARRAAPTPATVLLRGESGTGKEMFAHAIHNASNRITGQFVRVNCAAINENLLESELFGYVEGAFSGAVKGGKVGLFDEANGGTIFLDEIGEISWNLQTKLLRVLQEREILRVGDTKPRPIDVRVIAATNADLESLVEKKQFRQDLYFRLNVIPIYIPPLREREEDIITLINHIIQKLNHEYGRNISKVSQEGMEYLLKHDWPGNVRELENALGRAIINMKFQDSIIELKHLPSLVGRDNVAAIDTVDINSSYDQLFAKWEKKLLENVLESCKYNKTEAARKLNISIRNLYYKLEKHGFK